MVGLGVIGALGTFSFLPLVVSQAIAGLGMSSRAAGILAALEMAAGGMATLLASLVVHRINRRRIARFCLTLIVAGSVLSQGLHHYALMALGRTVTGLGEGGLIAVVIASMAATRVPERNFGLWTIANMAAASLLLFLIMPPVTARWGIVGVFSTYLCLAIPGFALAAWYPEYPDSISTPDRVPTAAAGTRTAIVLCLVAILFAHLAHGGIWAYLQRFGAAAGIEATVTEHALGYAAFAGLIGGSVVTALGTRCGRAIPNGVALVLSAASALLVTVAHTPEVFVAAAMGFYLAWVFGLPYLMGIISALDPRGRAATLGIVMQNAGLSAGPVGAGFLAGSTSQYHDVALAAFVLYAAAALIAVPLAYRLDRRSLN
jgi:predicted MFS family arabinose efflux permease